jgi:hypothetical protein
MIERAADSLDRQDLHQSSRYSRKRAPGCFNGLDLCESYVCGYLARTAGIIDFATFSPPLDRIATRMGEVQENAGNFRATPRFNNVNEHDWALLKTLFIVPAQRDSRRRS